MDYLDENVRRTVNDALNPNMPSPIDFLKMKPFSKEQIRNMIETIDSYCDGFEKEYSKFMNEFLKAFGSMLFILKDDNTNEITHFRGLLDYASQDEIEVFLIEGCNSEGIRLVKDIDIVYRKHEEVWFSDYKSVRSSRTYSVIKNQNKMSKLIQTFPEQKVSVITSPYNEKRIIWKHFSYESNIFDKEFSIADKLIDHYQSLTIDSIKDEIKQFVTEFEPYKPEEIPISNIKKEKIMWLSMKEKIIKGSQTNDSETARSFFECVGKIKNKDNYGLNLLESINQKDSKSITRIPLVENGSEEELDLFCLKNKNTLIHKLHLKDDFTFDGISWSCLDKENHVWKMEGNLIEMFHRNFKLSDLNTYEQMEDNLSLISKDLTSYCKPGLNAISMNRMINELPDDTDTDIYVKSALSSFSKTCINTKLMEWISCITDITFPVISSLMSKLNRKAKSSIKKGRMLVKVSKIKGRVGYMIHGLSGYTSKVKDVSCKIIGSFINLSDSLCRTKNNMESEWFNLSPLDLDWYSVLYWKSISVLSMRMDSVVPLKLKEPSNILLDEIPYLALLMIRNDGKLSEIMDSVRYVFMNTTGISRGSQKLIDKIVWYKPSKWVDKLYMLRLLKLNVFNLIVWKHYDSDLPVLAYNRVVVDTDKGSRMLETKELKIVLPDWKCSYGIERLTFNSFYISRLLSETRRNDTMREALVVKKMIESHNEFINLRDKIGPYSPDLNVVCYGALSNIVKNLNLKNISSGKLSDHLLDEFDFIKCENLTINDVSNTRSSVKTLKEYVKPGEISKVGNKVIKLKNSSKSYITNIDMWLKSQNLDQLGSLDSLKSSIRLLPIISDFQNTDVKYASIIFPKNKIGVREIASMNSEMRCASFLIETISRSIRDKSFQLGNKINQIELSSKDNVAKDSHSKGINMMKQGMKVIFDSADASTWGPTMMSFALYLTLGIRCKDKIQRSLIRSIFSKFSNKLAILPDNLCASKLVKSPTNTVSIVRKMIDEMNLENGNIMKFEEGMYQGILGNTSSVYHSDMLSLSELIHFDRGIKVESYCTSDDSFRLIGSSSYKSIRELSRISLSIHLKIGHIYGIKRNLYKSVFSNIYAEFNSVFRSNNGEYRPEIKTRSSFVDFSTSTDLYESAMNSLNQALEYLFHDGSIVGSTWVMLLNNAIREQQFSLHNYENRYLIPLELGGFILPRITIQAWSPKMSTIMSNYTGKNYYDEYSYKDLSWVIAFLSDVTNEEIIIDPNKSDQKIPSLTRSKTVNITARVRSSQRTMNNILSSISDDMFKVVFGNAFSQSVISVLLSNAVRELSTDDSDSSCIRLMKSLRPLDSYSYRLNDRFYGSELINRKMFKEKIDQYMKAKLVDNGSTFIKGNVEYSKIDDSIIKAMFSEYKRSLEIYRNTKILSTTCVPRLNHVKHEYFNYDDPMLAKYQNDMFSLNQLPIDYGGKSENSVRQWYINVTLYKQKMKKLLNRRINAYQTLMEEDIGTHGITRTIVSNIVEGCRSLVNVKSQEEMLIPKMKAINNLENVLNKKIKILPEGNTPIDMIFKDYPLTSVVDITNLIGSILSDDIHFYYMRYNEIIKMLYCLQEIQKTSNLQLMIDLESLEYKRMHIGYLNSFGTKDHVIADDEKIEYNYFSNKDSSWIHVITTKNLDLTTPRDTDSDKFKLENSRLIKVDLMDNNRTLCVKKVNGHILVPLCYSKEISLRKYVFKFNNLVNEKDSDSIRKIRDSSIELIQYISPSRDKEIEDLDSYEEDDIDILLEESDNESDDGWNMDSIKTDVQNVSFDFDSDISDDELGDWYSSVSSSHASISPELRSKEMDINKFSLKKMGNTVIMETNMYLGDQKEFTTSQLTFVGLLCRVMETRLNKEEIRSIFSQVWNEFNNNSQFKRILDYIDLDLGNDILEESY